MTRLLHEPAPPDGWWWVRLSPATPRGADRRWTVVRVLDGVVQPHGTAAWYSPAAPWLQGAEWVPAESPAGCGLPTTAITQVQPVDRREEAVRRVAGEIVDVFLGLFDAVAVYYRKHPEHRADLVAVVTRIMLRVVR